MDSRERTEFFAVFFEASRTILSSSSLEEILNLLVRRAAETLGAKGGSLRLVDEMTNRLELKASFQLSQRYLTKGPLEMDKSVPEVLAGSVVLIKDAQNDPRVQYREELREEGINAMLSVPVEAKDKVIGVLRLYMTNVRDLGAEEIEFVSALAELGGLAIVNARIYEERGIKLASLLQKVGVDLPEKPGEESRRYLCFRTQPVDPARSLEYFRMLHETLRSLLSTLNSEEVMALMIDKLLELMKVEACALRLINDTTRELELFACKGLSDRFLEKGPLHADKSICEALEGFPVLIADAKTDPRIQYPEQMAREGITTILSLPIVAMDRVVGVLRLYSKAARQYSQDEVAFLSALAEIAGILIMNARLYEKTKYDLSFWTATLGYLEGNSDHP